MKGGFFFFFFFFGSRRNYYKYKFLQAITMTDSNYYESFVELRKDGKIERR